MAESPIVETLTELLGLLRAAVKTRDEAAKQAVEYTNAIRALAQVCEDEEIKGEFLAELDEISGKPSFIEAIRSVLRLPVPAKGGLTATGIKIWIGMGKKLDLAAYSNPMASIHTTLRRMVDSGEVVAFADEKGEKRYRLANLPTPKRRTI